MSQSAHRILDVLEQVLRTPSTASDLARLLDVHRSTTLRLLHLLESRGYVIRDGEGAFSGGRRIVEMGEIVRESMDLRRLAKGTLQELHAQTSLTVHLAGIENAEVVYLDKYDSDTPIRMQSRVGAAAPLHCTGVAKAILAWSNAEQMEALKSRIQYTPFTSATHTDWESLSGDLRRCRERGYAIDNGEHEQYIRCIAAPILDSNREAFASVSLTTVAVIPLDQLKAFSGRLLLATAEISRVAGIVP